MTLLRLAPEIRAEVMALPAGAFSERALRRVAMVAEPGEQASAFAKIAGQEAEKPAA